MFGNYFHSMEGLMLHPELNSINKSIKLCKPTVTNRYYSLSLLCYSHSYILRPRENASSDKIPTLTHELCTPPAPINNKG
jgi:hypothetical protein